MKRHFILIGLILWNTMLLAKEHTYFGAAFGLSNTRSVKRDLEQGGNVLFLGKKFEVSGHPTAANNRQNILKNADARGEGFRLMAGYQWTDHFAFELSYDQFADAEFRESDGDKLLNKEYALAVQGIGRVPFYNGFDLTGRLGVSYLRSNLDFKGSFISNNNYSVNENIAKQSVVVSNALYGIGLAYRWNRKADVTFDFIRYHGTGKIDDVDVLQLGIVYHFRSEFE